MSSRLIRPMHLTLAIASWICFSAIAPRLSNAQVMSHQVDPAVPLGIHQQTFLNGSVCIEFQCVGDTDRQIVKASDPDPAEAERKAWDLVNAMCPGGIEYSAHLPPRSCRVISDTDPIETSAYRLQRASSRWVVKASLIYCDGSPGYKNVMIEGATRCEAIQNARQLLCCDLKDPCKAAYLTYCIAKQPCPPAPACVCPPRYQSRSCFRR